jgi:hypothetical protein
MFFSILALNILLKSVSKLSFFRSAVEIPGFGATISDAVARSSIVFCNSVSADRIVMAASRLLGAAAAYVKNTILSFAAGHRKSYWSGCIKAAILIWQQIFSILARIIYFKNHFKKIASNSSFFSLWRRDPVVVSLCRSHCNGCVKVAWHRGCMRNIILFCSWTS